MNGCWHLVEEHLNKTRNTNNHFISKDAIFGGCINQAWKVTDSNQQVWFIKENTPSLVSMFEAESAGLKEIQQSNSIRVPSPICYGTTNDFSYFVLEYIPMRGAINQRTTGELLAQMHRTFQSPSQTDKPFGWRIDNTIGSTPQPNRFHSEWITFWQQQRLVFQLELALQSSYDNDAYDAGLKLAENLPFFFSDYQPAPSLLHGDLWGGNCASDDNNQPIIFDPAIYYGDRETDIAMTELFGGFNQSFYSAYNDIYPLDSGYKVRKTLYNLYHILNHYNLFGGSYAAQANTMTQQLLSEIN